jgi:hypothetical protein
MHAFDEIPPMIFEESIAILGPPLESFFLALALLVRSKPKV